MNRMTELLERINYDLPGLKKAKMCYAQGDADGAMDAVIEHFRTRTTPKYLFTAKEIEQCKAYKTDKCIGCGYCFQVCPTQALYVDKKGILRSAFEEAGIRRGNK